jgi:tetratricopeptide (TPR) repeat protein
VNGASPLAEGNRAALWQSAADFDKSRDCRDGGTTVAKPKKKLSRKDLLRTDDAFLSAASQGARWMSQNRVQVIAGGVLVAAAILGTWGTVEYVRARDYDASLLFKRGIDLLDGEVLGVASEAEPDPEASEPTFGTDQEKWTAARDQFARVTEEAGGSGVASLAGFLAADLDEKLGDLEAAEERFLSLAGDLGTSDSLYFLAVERAAYLQEARGDVDGALRTLGKLVNVESGFYSDFASFHQARLYLGKGENSRARNIFQRIEEDFPASPILEEVRERLDRLGPAELPSEADPVENPGTATEPADAAQGAPAGTEAADTGAEGATGALGEDGESAP